MKVSSQTPGALSDKKFESIHDARYWDSPQFKLVSDFEPKGSQPRAIEKLVEGLNKKEQFQTLLGVTGSGKTYTVANVINQVQKPTLVIAHNKTLAAQLYNEFRSSSLKTGLNTLSHIMTITSPSPISLPKTSTLKKMPR